MKNFLILGIILVTLLVIGGCAQEQESTQGYYIDVTPAEAKELIDEHPDIIIIDVSPRYDQGHLPGAVHYYNR
jgi:hypothetical protein